MTGSPETLTAVVNLSMEGAGTAAGKAMTMSRSITFRRERWRQESTVSGESPVIEGLDGKVPYHMAGGHQVRGNENEVPLARAVVYHHPVGFLLACFSGNPQLSNSRVEEGQPAVDLTVDQRVYSLYLDSKTKLPAKIVSKVGGTVYETSFGQYQKVHGYTLPYHIVEKVDNQPMIDWTISRQFPGPDVPGLTVPKDLASAAQQRP